MRFLVRGKMIRTWFVRAPPTLRSSSEGYLSREDTRRLREAGSDTDTGAGDAGPCRDNLIAFHFYTFKGLPANGITGPRN